MEPPTYTPTTRICTICKQEKSLATDFGRQSNGKYGRQSACKLCVKKQIADYRKTPKGKAKYEEYARRHRQKPGYSEKHQAYRNTPKAQWNLYLKGAERRGLAFDFTVEDFTEAFWQKPCAYCGDDILTVGVDRVNNEEGYTKSNCVPCCKTCNFMKLQMSREAFLEKCAQIVKHTKGQ